MFINVYQGFCGYDLFLRIDYTSVNGLFCYQNSSLPAGPKVTEIEISLFKKRHVSFFLEKG